MIKLRKHRVLDLAERKGYREYLTLANALGITRNWLTIILNGSRPPSADLLFSMSMLLDCTIDDLIDKERSTPDLELDDVEQPSMAKLDA